MGALHVGEPRVSFQQQQVGKNGQQGHGHGAVVEEIHGLIKVYRDGFVERIPAIPDVPCTWGTTASVPGVVIARDAVVDRATRVWARLAYHEFLAKLAPRPGFRLNVGRLPALRGINGLPAAFDDGVTAVRWLRQQAAISSAADELSWWRGRCRFDRVFLAGDSAGATIAFHVAARLGHGQLGALTPLDVKGAILIQPFFGGETRTASEKTMPQPPGSALTLSTSDTYWRMSLPAGATRDHPWCNPVTGRGAPRLDSLPLPDFLVCISEQDILRDRNLELCSALRRADHSVEQATYGGVGHAFQVLNNYHLSQPRTQEMLAHIKAFVRAR
ncbi:hypothetical protein OsJ_10200 [Oryza sativa Japonica Group]|uniref:Alpha/beta hydrolase fold-3 domain-containing protein n=1 Tax=Oryza sativa subsp. japonica TaxID=39947 RepID=A3AG81_ORYSJ|nr:hypothetical protein OsJ_10200 [Oryza sativa Japonica Group]